MEFILRKICDYLPVKIIRDDEGIPFLYRYHVFNLYKDGPGMCIHHFVKSDPDRGYHDHPWNYGLSFIATGGYEERILNDDNKTFQTKHRKPWSFNFLRGHKFHRVMLQKSSWTIFFHTARAKTWNMIDLNGKKYAMSNTVTDKDGGWWKTSKKGISTHDHVPLKGNVILTVDIMVFDKEDNILLIKRGKEPYKDHWAFPGGRVEQSDRLIQDAAKRELKEETNIDSSNLIYYTQVANNYRDPRGFTHTSIFFCHVNNKSGIKAGDDAVEYKWFKIKDILNSENFMAFDHKEILEKYYNLI